MEVKYFSMFTGIGGFELGIGDRGTCIGYSEVDKYAIQIFEKHFPHYKNYGDATTIIPDELPNFDLLVGGFPCQSFSVAGKRGGFKDTRGTLFFDIARIIERKRPSYLLLENVKGLLNHDKGNTFATIVSTLDELGYDCEWSVLNSKNFGVPQNRERVFIVGYLRGKPRRQIFPFSGDHEEDNQKNISNTIDCNYYKGIDNHGQRTHIGTLRTHKDGQGFREVKSGNAPTLPARAREDGSGQPVIAVPLKFLNRNQRNYQGDYSFTVDGLNTGGVMQGFGIRRLTPKECERLQGFPDDWTSGISETQRYKCLGNAVTVNVISEIIKRLLWK